MATSTIIILACLFAVMHMGMSLALEGINDGINPFFVNVTGPTPPSIFCPDAMCSGRADGNYESRNPDGSIEKNFFLSCSGGKANCQPCWPIALEFSEQCNQCLYSSDGPCVTTKTWSPATTFECPDKCPQYGPRFSGNIEDPAQPRQYIACWMGVTVGCIACPENLMFNQTYNACLYEGKYWTRASAISLL